MVVALADSFFFDVDLDAARSRILTFLLVSFAPFVVVAPLIGPVIDRIRGGRRFLVQIVAVLRFLVQIAMIRYSGEIALFILVFGALVLQKTYAISKSALVPSVVRSDQELVEANSKLGLIAGITGAVAVVPAAILQILFSTPVTLAFGGIIFLGALAAAVKLPQEVLIAAPKAARKRGIEVSPGMRASGDALLLLRGSAGFLMFHLAFWLRGQERGTVWFALVVVASTAGTMLGNIAGPRLRRVQSEEKMVILALTVPALAGLVAVVVPGRFPVVVMAMIVAMSAGVARLAFESIVQRDASVISRGRVFAHYETRFQFGWVVAAALAVLLNLPGWLGLIAVSGAAASGLIGTRAEALSRMPRQRTSGRRSRRTPGGSTRR
jgi:Na+/melibiose symporter-like transporter